MIDTDKYEGHTEGPWEWDGAILTVEGQANINLMADAPLILDAYKEKCEEVKRLREQLGRYTQFVLWVEEEHNEVFDEYEGKDEL